MVRATFVFPGRLQPPHNDHLLFIERALERIEAPLVIGLITSETAPLPAAGFAARADEHHRPERNPLDYLARRRLLEAAITERGLDRYRLRIAPIPRPELDWETIVSRLPGPRCWVVPDAGDPFDDAKAAFFAERGEGVLRVPYQMTTDGWTVRRLWASGDRSLERHVPRAVFTFLTTRRAS